LPLVRRQFADGLPQPFLTLLSDQPSSVIRRLPIGQRTFLAKLLLLRGTLVLLPKVRDPVVSDAVQIGLKVLAGAMSLAQPNAS